MAAESLDASLRVVGHQVKGVPVLEAQDACHGYEVVFELCLVAALAVVGCSNVFITWNGVGCVGCPSHGFAYLFLLDEEVELLSL